MATDDELDLLEFPESLIQDDGEALSHRSSGRHLDTLVDGTRWPIVRIRVQEPRLPYAPNSKSHQLESVRACGDSCHNRRATGGCLVPEPCAGRLPFQLCSSCRTAGDCSSRCRCASWHRILHTPCRTTWQPSLPCNSGRSGVDCSSRCRCASSHRILHMAGHTIQPFAGS